MQTVRRIAFAAAVLFTLYAIGTIGYFFIADGKASLLDALYMTVTTLGSVGFGEITPGAASPIGRMFTIGLSLSGMVTLVFVTTSLTAFFVEGDMTRLLEKRKMDKLIAKLKDHYIVCGSGSTGVHIIAELVATERPVIFIEANPERVQHALAHLKDAAKNVAYLIGDATDDLLLRRAGVERARGLAAALPSDKDNLFITIAAKQLNPSLRIIARVVELSSVEKLKRAGAQSVVSPNMIGGMRMVSELVRPNVVSFLDLMLRDKDKNMRVEEITVGGPHFVGKTLDHAHFRDEFDVSVLAVRKPNEADFSYNPKAQTMLEQGMVIIVLGHASGVARLRTAAEA